jgi:hypothetical protein
MTFNVEKVAYKMWAIFSIFQETAQSKQSPNGLPCDLEVRGHCSKEMPVIPVNKVVDTD